MLAATQELSIRYRDSVAGHRLAVAFDLERGALAQDQGHNYHPVDQMECGHRRSLQDLYYRLPELWLAVEVVFPVR
jgi:hypothetical protein